MSFRALMWAQDDYCGLVTFRRLVQLSDNDWKLGERQSMPIFMRPETLENMPSYL